MDEIQGRCVGFTTKHISGGTLEEDKTRVFKLKWLHQLISVIDELNLNLGIAHQDVAPRNLLIDDSTDSIMIFDFNFSVRIGEVGYDEHRNDIKGAIFTMYEIITRDATLREVEHQEQNLSDIENKEWILHPDVRLDHPVSDFRETLSQWSERRRQGRQVTSYKDAPNFIDWPNTPEPPPSEVVINYSTGPVTQLKVLWSIERWRMIEQGKEVLNWQRPPQAKLKPGDRLLATGELISEI